ncbi:MAG: hypothetical protein IT374_21295 [Polyangiaceae bacterium]|nr:hypothetical protein [Polyangiaceae bacterium]
MTIVTSGDVTGFFREAVDDALREGRVDATDGARQYLADMLAGRCGQGVPRDALDKPVTLLLDEALHAPATERLERLRDVGDGTLALSGLYHDHLERRGVDSRYVGTVGKTAYGAAAGLLSRGDGPGALDLFGELAEKFDRLAEALRRIADGIFAAPGTGPDALLRVYERWLRTGSSRLERALISEGLLPMRPQGGLQ